MEFIENFEYYFKKDGKFYNDVFSEKTHDTNWEIKFIESQFNRGKFRTITKLLNVFEKHKLPGRPSNTGISGFYIDEVFINGLSVKWHSNFGYEDTSYAFEPYVELSYKEILLKKIPNVINTQSFIHILNQYVDTSKVITLIENELGIEECYKKLKGSIDLNEIIKIFSQ